MQVRVGKCIIVCYYIYSNKFSCISHYYHNKSVFYKSIWTSILEISILEISIFENNVSVIRTSETSMKERGVHI